MNNKIKYNVFWIGFIMDRFVVAVLGPGNHEHIPIFSDGTWGRGWERERGLGSESPTHLGTVAGPEGVLSFPEDVLLFYEPPYSRGRKPQLLPFGNQRLGVFHHDMVARPTRFPCHFPWLSWNNLHSKSVFPTSFTLYQIC